jgi:hypothetical protein
VCASRLESGARKCTACGSYQDGRECVSCGTLIPRVAAKCPACNSFQNWRRSTGGLEVVLALTISLISVVAAIGPALIGAWNFRSRTEVRVLGSRIPKDATSPVLVVSVINTGRRPALVESVDLKFDGLPVQPKVLRVVNLDGRFVAPGATAVLEVTTDGLQLVPGETKETVKANADRAKAIVTASVEEITRWGGRRTVDRSDDCPASEIERWIDAKTR